MGCQLIDNTCFIIIIDVMETLTVRQIAENSGVSPQAVRQWQPSDFTPEAIAKMVLEKAETKEAQATVLIAQVQKMRTYARQLQEASEA